MKTIMITGGAGFIGSHLCEMYVQKGYKVICVDNLSSGSLSNVSSLQKNDLFKFVEVDICDNDKLEQVFQEYKPDVINHHAAQKSVAYSVEDPAYDLKINGMGFLNVLQRAIDHKIESFIYVSSGGALSKEIIGDDKSKEEDFPQLKSPYAINKFSGENLLALYSEIHNFKFTVLRYANVYGPRQIADGECGVIPIFIDNITIDKKSILMTYPDMPRGCTRDYVYIKDVVKANELVTETPVNTVINIGSGIELPILDIYESILEVFNKDLEIEIKGPRAGDIKRSVLDSSRVLELLGWTPSYSLKEGLTDLKKSME